MSEESILRVVFFRTDAGREPVREWLRSLNTADRKIIGEDIKLIEFGWPLGMPLVRKIESGLWEIRSRLSGHRIARVFFTVQGSQMALLHGLMKKSQKIQQHDLNLARDRRNLWQSQEVVK